MRESNVGGLGSYARLRGTASPPGPHRSSLPRPDGPLPADSLEGARSVGAVEWCQFTAGNGCEGPQALQAATDHRCHERMGHCRPIRWRAPAPSAPLNPMGSYGSCQESGFSSPLNGHSSGCRTRPCRMGLHFTYSHLAS